MNKDNTQLEWEQIPEEIRIIAGSWANFGSDYEKHRLQLAIDIMQAIKPIVENAWFDGNKGGDYGFESHNFETYWNSLITKGI